MLLRVVLNYWAPAIHLPQSPQWLGLQVQATHPITLMYRWESCLFVLLGTEPTSRQMLYD